MFPTTHRSLCGSIRLLCAFTLLGVFLLSSAALLIAQSPATTSTPSAHILSSVTVIAKLDDLLDANLPTVTGEAVLSSAGSFGDVGRYLQSMPGVTAQSDTTTGMVVRGGNPAENLFLVNGFEVPNLNHIATGSSTGGFASMIDASLIDSILIRSSGFSAMEADRLSSVVEVNTLRPGTNHAEGDVGMQGAGLTWQKDIDKHTSLLLSAHHGLANLFTNNIGVDGVPDYTNGIATLTHGDGSRNHFTALALGGQDTLNMTPCWLDPVASSNIQTQYAGWRFTGGFAWTHTYSARAASTLRLTDNNQSQRIGQQQQSAIAGYSGSIQGTESTPCTDLTPAQKLLTVTATSVYREATHDSLRSLNYAFELAPRRWMVLSTGFDERLNTRNYSIAQPAGTLSAYSSSTTRSDATTMHRDFTSGEGSAFGSMALHLSTRWTVDAGIRLQHFAINSEHAFSPRISMAYRYGSTILHGSLASYVQQPPAMMMLAWRQNQKLASMHTIHAVVGADLFQGHSGRLGIEVYHKSYSDLPVATEYPQVNFENLVDSLDQQFTWLPMTSKGSGEAYGAELTSSLHVGRKLELKASAGWAKARFRGLDGISRAGNYEIPVTTSLSGTWQISRSTLLTFRAQAASGRPYTPFNYAESAAQNRGIYDLTKLNALHGPTYSRVDLQLNRRINIMHHTATIYAGLSNVLDQQNLLGYFWSSQAGLQNQYCATNNCVVRVNQMPVQSNFGARYSF